MPIPRTLLSLPLLLALLLAPATANPLPHGHAYAADGSDVTALDPRVAGAAGELVTTLDDLDRFYAALLGGRLLPRDGCARCSTPGPHTARTA